MKYTVCTSYPSGKETQKHPNVNDIIDTVKIRMGLDVSEGPYMSVDVSRICFTTNDAILVLELITLFKDEGIASYWYSNSPLRERGEVCHFGNGRNRRDI